MFCLSCFWDTFYNGCDFRFLIFRLRYCNYQYNRIYICPHCCFSIWSFLCPNHTLKSLPPRKTRKETVCMSYFSKIDVHPTHGPLVRVTGVVPHDGTHWRHPLTKDSCTVHLKHSASLTVTMAEPDSLEDGTLSWPPPVTLPPGMQPPPPPPGMDTMDPLNVPRVGPPPWPPWAEPPPPWATHMSHPLVNGPVWRDPNWTPPQPPMTPPPCTDERIARVMFRSFPEGCGASPSASGSKDPYIALVHSPLTSPSTTTVEWPW